MDIRIAHPVLIERSIVMFNVRTAVDVYAWTTLTWSGKPCAVMVTYMVLVEIVVGEVQYFKDTTLIELSVSMSHDAVAFIQDG
jgi:hypothetical protein